MNIIKKIWHFFFPKPVETDPHKILLSKRDFDNFKRAVDNPPPVNDRMRQAFVSTNKVQGKRRAIERRHETMLDRTVPRVAVPPPPPPMKKYYPHDAVEAERRIRNEMREKSRQEEDTAADALIGLGVGLALGALLDNDSSSSSSFSDVSSSVDTTESWSGGGGESGGGGSSGEW